MPLIIPALMSGLGAMARVAPAAVRGYKTFKKARQIGGLGTSKAAQTAGQKSLGQKGLAALAKGERKLFKKSPLTAGGIETGLSAPFAAEGVMDVGKGLYENDYGQVASGLGTLALTVPFLGRGLRMTGASKTIPASVRDPIYQTGRAVQKGTPKGTFPAGLALTGVGAFTERPDAQAQGQDPQVLGDDPVQMVIKAIENDKRNPKIDTTSPDYKKQAQQILTNAYQAAEKSGIKSSLRAHSKYDTSLLLPEEPALLKSLLNLLPYEEFWFVFKERFSSAFRLKDGSHAQYFSYLIAK